MSAQMSEPASVMCTLCGVAGTVETKVERVEARASAAAWALHFALEHPNEPAGVSRFLVMTPGSESKKLESGHA